MAVYDTDFSLVKRAIDSVLKQDFQDFEMIVIDDGSQNGTQNQLLNYIIQNEDKISYLRHANCGQSESINRGILNSTGEYITILDADDQYKPNHLSSCLKAISSLDLIASTTETIVDSSDDFYVPDKYDHNQLVHIDDCILFATLFGKKEVFMNLKFQKKYAADAQFYESASKKYAVNLLEFLKILRQRNRIINTATRRIRTRHRQPMHIFRSQSLRSHRRR